MIERMAYGSLPQTGAVIAISCLYIWYILHAMHDWQALKVHRHQVGQWRQAFVSMSILTKLYAAKAKQQEGAKTHLLH